MQKDKKLNELLMQHAMEETGADFTAGVMNEIEALQTPKPYVVPMFQGALAKILIGIFAFACMALLIVTFVAHPFEPEINFNILSPSYTMQLIYFFTAFWLVMLANLWWNKRNNFFTKEA